MTITELIHKLEAFAEQFPDAKVWFATPHEGDMYEVNNVLFGEPPRTSSPEICLSMESI